MASARRTGFGRTVQAVARRRFVLAVGLATALTAPVPAHGQPTPGTSAEEPQPTAETPEQGGADGATAEPTSPEVVTEPESVPEPPAPTPPVPEVESAAERLFQEGLAALQREDYATALVAFERARAIEERPILLFNIAMCRRALLHYPEAIAMFNRYLLLAEPDTPEERRQQVRDLIAEMERNLGRVSIRVDPDGAIILIDGERIGTTPLAELVRLGPGSHVVEVRREGFRDARQAFDIMAGETKELAVVLEPVAPAPNPVPTNPEEEDGGVVESWWFWTLIGAVVVGGAVTTGVLLWPEDETPAWWHVEGP